MSDSVEHPSHYNAGSVETIDGIRAALGDAFLDYCRGNVIKYVWRCRHKGKLLEDLRKAAKYLEWAIEAAESEKPSKPQELAIPEGWRELEENEPLSEDDLFEFDGEWVGHECDPSGGTYSSRIHCRHIRKIETENTSETPSSSLPDPGPGYRLLSKDPPERVVEGDEYLDLDGEWIESENWRAGVVQCSAYYRRKIEPNEWIPKVGDKVRLRVPVLYPTRDSCNYEGRITGISQSGRFTIFFASEDQRIRGWVKPKDLHLVEAAQ